MTTKQATLTARFKPASMGAVGRLIHEVRVYDDGSVVWWIQPTTTDAPSGALHSEVCFAHGQAEDLIADVAAGRLVAVPLS